MNRSIKEIAESFIGKQEISGNLGFKDKEFEKKMKGVGFEKGFAWCSLFSELVWTEYYRQPKTPVAMAKIKKLCSASAVTTYNNFKNDPEKTFTVSQTPKVGAIVIWKHGKGPMGHAGIVVEVLPDGKTFKSVEGNTNAAGGREGIEVALKTRKIGQPFLEKGLNVAGFIYPI